MSVFKRGQEIGPGDLIINLKNKSGGMQDAAEIYYNIYDFTTGSEILLPPNGRSPVQKGVGSYYASFFIPRDANLGKYRIRWFFRQRVNSQQVQILQEFNIVADTIQTTSLPNASNIELGLVQSLRTLLRDNNPDRNYHFRPPAGEESINEFTRVFGYVWEDQELLEYLNVSLDAVNLYPPLTFYNSVEQLITQNRPWRYLLLHGAMFHATTALALNWIVDEFDYSIGGTSLSIERSSKYQSMSNDLYNRFTADAEKAKETVKVIRGLKQSRYGVGVRSSFGPSVGRGALTPRRFLGV